MTFWENDLDIFFQDFAIDATYLGQTIKVIFHNEYEAGGLFDGNIETKNPYIEIKSSDTTDMAHGEIIQIGSVGYKVRSIQPDSTGISTIILSKD